MHLPERGEIRRRSARAVLAGLPRHIGEREIATVAELTRWPASALQVAELPAAWGPGNVVLLEVESERITEVFSSVGRRGMPAEKVARDAAMQAVRYLETDVPVGDCLADQLLLPMAVAGKGSFRTLPLTRHSQTHIEVIRMFLNVPVKTREPITGVWEVEVG